MESLTFAIIPHGSVNWDDFSWNNLLIVEIRIFVFVNKLVSIILLLQFELGGGRP